MAIVRYEPGGLMPADGRYVLVGHYGEPIDLLVSCRQGERFPAAVGSDEVIDPMSFVRIFFAEEEVRTSIAA